MDHVTLGSTGITVNKNGFGALPLQRVGVTEAVMLLKKAYNNGITFFDTARDYTDSEQKLGEAFSEIREQIFIATKNSAKDADTFWKQLETSLGKLKTDHIDIYQFHNPPFCPKPGDASGIYDAMLEAKARGMVKHIGFTNHRLELAREAAESGLYETVQYPISYLSAPQELELIRICADRNVGVIAMKAMSGGLVTDSAAAYAFMMQFDNLLPIWGVQRECELDEFLAYHDAPPILDERARQAIERDKAELGSEFCRGCGYCLPCPANIFIPTAARMSVLMKRAHVSLYLGDAARETMKRVKDCIDCGHCKEHCPYELDAPRLMQESLAEYNKLLQGLQ